MQANIFRHKRKLARTAFCFTLLLSLSAALLPRAYAQSHTDRKFSPETGAIVNTTIELMNADDFKASLANMDELLENHELTPFEKSTILQIKGQAFYEVKQTGKAIQAFEDAIDAGGLLDSETSQLRLNIGQLLIGDGQYARGAEMIEQWEHDGNQLTPNHIELLVQAWVSSDNYARALPWAEKWFETANPKERKHYNLLNFLYNHLGLNVRQSILLDEMKERWPEDFEDK